MNQAKNELRKIHCLISLTSIANICRVGSLSSAKQTAVHWTKRSTDGNGRFSKHRRCVYAVLLLRILPAAHCAAGVARFPFCEKQSRVRFGPGLYVVDTHTVNAPRTGMWTNSGNPCLETACRNQHWGKIKHFFSNVYVLPRSRSAEGSQGPGQRTLH